MEASVGLVEGVSVGGGEVEHGVGEGVTSRFLRHSRPSCRIMRALARRDWPERIIHPQPVSELKPSRSAKLRRRTEKEIPVLEEGS